MDRRDFILKGGAGMIALTLLGKKTYAFSPKAESAGSCVPTTADILGPFYRAGAPFRSDLTVTGEAGTALIFKGRVLDEACNPIANAIVDVWHADDAGAYDNTTANFDHRGKFQTSATGEYEFTSVKAGWYLNGSQYRPSHIHFRVTAPGHTELITQLYFQNDPYIANDPWASDPDASLRIVPITSVAGADTAEFDIYLDATSSGMLENDKPSPVKFNENPFSTEIRMSCVSEQLLHFELFNTAGQLVTSKYDINGSELKLPAAYLGNGTYYGRVQTEKNIYVHKLLKG